MYRVGSILEEVPVKIVTTPQNFKTFTLNSGGSQESLTTEMDLSFEQISLTQSS